MEKNDKDLGRRTEATPLGFFKLSSLKRLIVIFFGTFCFTGYFPIAPGSFSSFTALLVLYFSCVSGVVFFIVFSTVLFFAGVLAGFILEKDWGKDPSKIVIDEVVIVDFVVTGVI